MKTTKVVEGMWGRIGKAVAALAVGAALTATPALADSAPPGPSESAVINLIRLLVKQGVITADAADALVKQAEAEAVQARAANASTVASAAPTSQAIATAPEPAPGVLRVPYVPELVKQQLRYEVRQDVLAQAKSEGWALPGRAPEWVSRIEISGDFRFRDEFDRYAQTNTNEFIDYATFNANGPTDINDVTNPNGVPFLNTRQNRNDVWSLRARLGLKAKVTDAVTVGIRLATGKDNSPVSTTQAFGGGFDKKDIWLDQAYVTLQPVSWAGATLGRMTDPFMHTDLVFDENLNFDGAAATITTPGDFEGFGGFATAGAFPIDYLPGAFPTVSTDKGPDSTKWLFGGQVGGRWKNDDLNARIAVAYYDFRNVEGVLSDPCALYTGVKQCSSDNSRPDFMHKGNTLFLIRNITPNPATPLNFAQPQFVGLSYDYNLIDANAEFDARLWGDRHLLLQADYVRNLAYNPAKAFAKGTGANPVNNYLENASTFDLANYQSGPTGWMAKATFGDPRPRSPGSWNVGVGYKYIEPDAVLDGFNDNDFHLGGTNAKGYFAAASVGIFTNTWLTGRWFSANEVFGPPLSIDVLQLELNTSF